MRNAHPPAERPRTAPLWPAVVWEVYDHRGKAFACFPTSEDAHKVARYLLRPPGFAQAAML